MVLAKYVISLNTMTLEDGSFKDGLAIDYTVVQKELTNYQNQQQAEPLLAYNPVEPVVAVVQTDIPATNHHHAANESPDIADSFVVTETENLEGPAPMEYANTLVVYNPSNPVIAQMTTQYLDPEDSEPLDQGNTLINEMQMMMPRR
ncbi:MAG: hypothetical protein HYZ14_17690 [Bacteroidetes bacterium]|nr:hypothetical protein [Bacteroidota bacterium]